MWSLVLAAASFIATIYVRDFWAMCGMTFLFAFFGDAFRPANQVAIRMNSNEATRTRAFSLMRIAVNLAISIALVGGGLLVRLGWEWLFWVDGLTCFGAALLLYFFVNARHLSKFIKLRYFVGDGDFYNNTISKIVVAKDLHLISKLQYNAALYFPFEGAYSGKGPHAKYGKKE